MPTRLNRYAEGVMEAAWLAAIVMAPLFFNKYSSRIFEPDKATLLRTLALIMLLAWVVKLVDQTSAGRKGTERFSLKTLWLTPTVIPVALLALSFLISTIFSVSPRISFWGSYQRLQGLYTTLAYLILFITMVANLRDHTQVERLITTLILTSLPVSLYGILQHFGIDPIPWGGDVTRRVASHMGNPIFVAAFLILIFPLTIGRIVDSFHKILQEKEGLPIHTARATVYIFIAALQTIAIFYTQSRGPWLGLFSGGFFLFVLLSLFWRKRWLTFTFLGIAVLAAAFLVVLNIQDGPLVSLQSMDSFRRLGQLLDPQSRTAQVRSLIWGGSYEMVTPHEPLEYPDGRVDPFNIVRPLIGYGPETMHWAYNRFYPPELAYVEARNASPDRSHNETWDTLVFTGVFGFLAYLGFFTTLFYFGLQWLGLIQTTRQRILFFLTYFGSGIITAVIFSLWQGIAFAGLGLPFGLILGLIIYLALVALVQSGGDQTSTLNDTRSLTLIVLLSAVVSHFAEINFGISIISTKTTFFAFAGLIVAVGYTLPLLGQYTNDEGMQKPDVQKTSSDKRQKKKRFRRGLTEVASTNRTIIIGGVITGMLILPMNYEYISNLGGLTSTLQILWTSLTQVNQNLISYGVLALIITTWLCAGVILTSESRLSQSGTTWWKIFGGILGISSLIGIVYSTWLSGSLAALARMAPKNIDDVILQTAGLERLLTQYYGFLIIGLLILAMVLPMKRPLWSRHDTLLGTILAITGFVFILWLSVTTNLKIIHADIAFKMAEPFSNSRQWGVSNTLYRRAIELSPDEDYYYLFLGRGSHEYAKTLTDPIEMEKAFKTAEADLVRAQTISPLNPDHARNLARLHSWWALQAEDEGIRVQRGLVSNGYFTQAISLSPNNVQIWNEWASLYYQVLEDPEKALELITQSLEIDDAYDWTHAFAGDIYSTRARIIENEDERMVAFDLAEDHYKKAIEIQPEAVNYYFALANVYLSTDNTQKVIDTLEDSLAYVGEADIWKVEDNLTKSYIKMEDFENALLHAQMALANAPQTEVDRLKLLIDQIQAVP